MNETAVTAPAICTSEIRAARPIAHIRLLSILELSLSILLGGLLLYSGVLHLGNPYLLLASVLRYQIVPPMFGAALAICLPILQIAIGLSLIGRTWRDAALLAACGLFAVFALAQCLALGRGLEIPCGCFGTTRYEPVGAWTVARTLGLLVLAALALAISLRKAGEPAGGGEA